MSTRHILVDGNEAAARVAYALDEVIAIYPITPSSPMGEHADAWATQGQPNLWGAVPSVVEMQSEGGAAGAVHGALQCGSLTTTFTASQGLLLMIPNMYKIAGELTPAVFHVAARSVAAQALSIFGDHSDVMAARATGWGMLASGSVQEVHDLALIAHAVSLRARVPFLHFFDGFRTSHEIQRIEALEHEDMAALVPEDLVHEHRARALDPEAPVVRGTAQNPDVFFQAREAVNPFYDRCPDLVEEVMQAFEARTGRAYRPFQYHGSHEAERVVVLMGSGAEAAHEAVDELVAEGEAVGVLKVRLYRPFDAARMAAALPATTKVVAALDRTKEPGSAGEPLYLDVRAALAEAAEDGRGPAGPVRVLGGRYGLSSKEFTPALVRALFTEMAGEAPRRRLTLGIHDDLGGTSLALPTSPPAPRRGVWQGVFYGLGSDGTVGANKNSIKILGEQLGRHVQGYFVYDSKKAGATTVSHLRVSEAPIRSTYLVGEADFVGVHQPQFLARQDVLASLAPGGTVLVNSPLGQDEVWGALPRVAQQHLVDAGARLFAIDAARVAREAGVGRRINTVMQTCFFALAGLLPEDEALEAVRASVEKTYGTKGRAVVERNLAAVAAARNHLVEVPVPAEVSSDLELEAILPPDASDFARAVTGPLLAGAGDALPVSALPCDGTYPTGTSRLTRLRLAEELPAWDASICIQCGKCAMVCPHSAIRTKVWDPSRNEPAAALEHAPVRGADLPEGHVMTIQVAPDDCTGCALCHEVCPAKDRSNLSHKALDMVPAEPRRPAEREAWAAFLELPELDRRQVRLDRVQGSQVLEPLFEFSGACSGCGETPYLKLVSQLFGDRAVIANATGCSSIYGGNLPTTPWSKNAQGRGPAWSNSLFEDNAEFGLGFRVSLDSRRAQAAALLAQLRPRLDPDLVDALLAADESDEAGVHDQRLRVEALRDMLAGLADDPRAARLQALSGDLCRKSVWIVGGDGWAYDIGYGGLDHVLASGRDVNILVMDTEVYSNTGGQASKATPLGAVAKFAAGGKVTDKKDLAWMAMAYGNVYVAQVAMGGKDTHTLRALLEAEAYPGPSIVIAYSHCVAHGIPMRKGLEHQKLAVDTGHWPLFRYDPRRAEAGEPPLRLDSRKPKVPIRRYLEREQRYRILERTDPDQARRLQGLAQDAAHRRWQRLEHLASAAAPSDEGIPV